MSPEVRLQRGLGTACPYAVLAISSLPPVVPARCTRAMSAHAISDVTRLQRRKKLRKAVEARRQKCASGASTSVSLAVPLQATSAEMSALGRKRACALSYAAVFSPTIGWRDGHSAGSGRSHDSGCHRRAKCARASRGQPAARAALRCGEEARVFDGLLRLGTKHVSVRSRPAVGRSLHGLDSAWPESLAATRRGSRPLRIPYGCPERLRSAQGVSWCRNNCRSVCRAPGRQLPLKVLPLL